MRDRLPDPENPQFVAAAAAGVSVVALYAYTVTTELLTAGLVSFVLLAVLLPTTVAYWLARRLFDAA